MDAFQAIEQEYATSQVLKYFDWNLCTMLQREASMKEFRAVLLQDKRPACFVLHSVTLIGTNCQNIKYDCLGTAWDMQ